MGKLLLVIAVCCFMLPVAVSGQQLNACDLNADSVLNAADFQLAVFMALGKTACISQVFGSNVCNIVVVQRVVNASLGYGCLTGNHSVTLTWVASTSTNVTGYKIYRGAIPGGPYTLIQSSPVAGTTWVDKAVTAGATYYYVVTATDGSNESVFSNEATATIPTP